MQCSLDSTDQETRCGSSCQPHARACGNFLFLKKCTYTPRYSGLRTFTQNSESSIGYFRNSLQRKARRLMECPACNGECRVTHNGGTTDERSVDCPHCNGTGEMCDVCGEAVDACDGHCQDDEEFCDE